MISYVYKKIAKPIWFLFSFIALDVVAESNSLGSYSLNYANCEGSQIPDKANSKQLRCGWLYGTKKARETIRLPFAILRAGLTQTEEALIIVPGGPGLGAQTAKENLAYWREQFADTDRAFDLVLYSPRGTEGAVPSFSCDHLKREEQLLLAENLSTKREQERRFNAIAQCLTGFENAEFTTLLGKQAQVADLDALINLLPYKRVHLFADSWGTRVALHAQAAKIQTRMLDSVYPPGKGGMEDWLSLLDLRFAIYRGQFAGFDARWALATGRLDKSPLRVNSIGGLSALSDKLEFVVNSQRLAHIAFYALYRENLRAPFINMLSYVAEEQQGNNQTVALADIPADVNLLLKSYLRSWFDPAFSPLAWYAAECGEHSTLTQGDFVALTKNFGGYKYLWDGMWTYDPCRLPALRTAEQKPLPINLRVPTLILSGELDPVTPNTWAKALQKELGDQAMLYTAKRAGHGVIAGDYCSSRLLVDFVRVSKVDTAFYCN